MPVADRPPSGSTSDNDSKVRQSLDRYWRKNLLIMRGLLVVWALVSLGCGVLLAAWLNHVKIGGFPLGFWFAQQGSIIVFVLIILLYCLLMNRLDKKHHDELQSLRGGNGSNGGASAAPGTASGVGEVPGARAGGGQG